jgi:hypothetical protein
MQTARKPVSTAPKTVNWVSSRGRAQGRSEATNFPFQQTTFLL